MSRALGFAIALGMAIGSVASAQQGQPGGHFIENWDLDGDGQMTMDEAREKRGDLFTMFDQDENGQLDGGEYDLFDETRQADMAANAGGHQKGGMKNVGKGLVRAFNDTDGDGLVSRSEFVDRTGDWFQMIDQNGDGVVTTEDFSRSGG